MRVRPRLVHVLFRQSSLLLFVACGGEVDRAVDGGMAPPPDAGPSAIAVIERGMSRIDSAAAAIDSIFQPLPLLRPNAEAALGRYSNAQHLARARTLGIERALPAAAIAALESDGRLVRLSDTGRWRVRDLDYSQPLVVPGVVALLDRIGERFHERLAELGAPAFRLEITSVLRTADDQAALRAVNPNAASGESAHEYGTTIDILYSAYSAPIDPIATTDVAGFAAADSLLRRYAEVAAERVAGRRSHELRAILGEVLLEVQNEGVAMVTLERQQPVYHVTLAEDL